MLNSFVVTLIIILFIIVVSLAFYQILYFNRHKYYRDKYNSDNIRVDRDKIVKPMNINTANCPAGCNRDRKCPNGSQCNNCKPGNMQCCCYDSQCKKCN